AGGNADVFIGAAAPSAVEHLIGQAQTLRVTAVTVPGWELLTAPQGKGQTAEPSRAPIWDQQATGKGSASLTIDQADAPQRVLVTTPRSGKLESLEVTMTNSGWGTSAIWLTILGVVLLLGGILLAIWGVWSRRRPTTNPTEG
ncbi:hypothetical protein, partial [Kribbia dieselivorans]|uniref:hypothetical protein n=1 Tax=Kribbia dieselivorans TaxID=331526 RepID=UPI0014707A5E